MFYIYCLRDLENKVTYVGQTQIPDRRKREHKRKKPPHTFEILEEVISDEEAKDLEIYYIYEYNTYHCGWNKTPGGEGFHNYSRSGIGGAKKGSIPWNKGKKNCFSEESINKMKKIRKGRVFSRKITDEQIRELRTLYEKSPSLSDVGKIMKNGKKMSYIQSFCKQFAERYGLTPQGVKRIILKECWKNV